MKARLALYASLTLLLLSTVAPAALPLADKLPEGAMVYIGWAGRNASFDGAYIGQFIQEPEAKEFFAALQARCVAMAADPQHSALIQQAWALHNIGWKHAMGLAILDVNLPSPDAAAKPAGMPPAITGAMLVDLGDDRGAFDAQLQATIALVKERLPVTAKSAGTIAYQSFTCPGGAVSFGYVGNIFFLTLGEDTPQQIIALIGGKGKSLDKDPAFIEAMKEVAGEHCQVAVYKNVSKAYGVIDRWMPTSQPAPSSAPAVSELHAKLNTLGMGNISTFAGAANLEDRQVHVKMRLVSPAPHQGVLMLLAGAPLEDKNLAAIPADADFALASHLDPVKVLSEVRRIAMELEPRYAIGGAAALGAIGAAMGIDIEQDLLATMGDEWTLIGAESLGGFPTGIMLTMELKDAAKFAQTQAKIENYLSSRLGKDRYELRKMQFTKDIDIHYVMCIGKPIAPAWAVANGRVYVALWPQVLMAALDANQVKPLTGNGEFQALRHKVLDKPSTLLYLNEPALLKRTYAALLMYGTQVTQSPRLARLTASQPAGGERLAVEPAGQFLPEMIPALPKLEKYFTPEITTLSSDPRGITFEAYGSLPLPALLVSASPLLPLTPMYHHAVAQHMQVRMHATSRPARPMPPATAPAPKPAAEQATPTGAGQE